MVGPRLFVALLVSAFFCGNIHHARFEINKAQAAGDFISSDGGQSTEGQGDAALKIVPIDRQKIQAELLNLYSVIENQYGPLSIKNKTIGLDWNNLKAEYIARVATLKSAKDFYFLVAEFLGRLDDAHVSIVLPTTLKYILPMQFSYINGKTVVNFIDLKLYPKNVQKPQIGDELVAVDGETLADYQKHFSVFNKFGNELTNHAMFARYLSSMSEASGVPLSYMPQSVVLTFKSQSGSIYNVSMQYYRTGIGMFDRPIGDVQAPSSFSLNDDESPAERELKVLLQTPLFSGVSDETKDKLLRVLRFAYQYQKLLNLETQLPDMSEGEDVLGFAPTKQAKPEAPTTEGKRIDLAHREPTFQLPSDFKEITPPGGLAPVFNGNNFFAGTFKRNGKTIGFLRIPEYMASVIYTLPFSIRFYIGKLQAVSDELIIDQTDNPGGMVFFSDLFIKSLVGKYDTTKHLRFAVKPSQGFMRQFASIIETVNTQLVGVLSDQRRQDLTDSLVTELKKIQTAYLTGAPVSEPISMLATSEIVEEMFDSLLKSVHGPLSFFAKHLLGVDIFSPQVYTKPVFFLTNELDFSGGDATPATFQDYGRGKIVGVRTAGAGGTVEEFSERNNVEFTYRLTTSLMIRKDGGLVENYGVKPDIDFTATVDDYRDGFKTYLGRLLQALNL